MEPIELGYLAAAAGPEHHTRILDLRLVFWPKQALTRTLRAFQPDLVGITGYTHEASSVKRIAALVRQQLPRAVVVVGGHHATVEPTDYRIDAIDAIVRGEGCGPFTEIVEAVAAGRGLDGMAQVLRPDATWRDDEAAHWPLFPDPAVLPLPRRDLWDTRRYRTVWTAEKLPPWHPLFPRVSMVRTSWGCRMKCSFCIVPHLCGGKHQTRPVDSVVEEIASLEAEHVYFCDDENFIDEDFAWRLADGLAARGVTKRFFAWARSSTVNRSPELMKRWREVGLDAVFLGFEFPSDSELKRAKKGATVASNERALEVVRSMGIAAHAAFMVQPEYGHEEFSHLRDYVQQLPPLQCSFTVCTPSPGTPDYAAIKDKIWVPNPHDLHDCMHPLTPTKLPLKEFARLFAEQASNALEKVPMRVNKHLGPPDDMVRTIWAGRQYHHGLKTIYRDYPKDLW